jgi:hypothetical protein
MEHWIEVNLFAELADQDHILLDVLWPYVKRLERRRALLTWHYFREPELRFRIRMKTKASKRRQMRMISKIAGVMLKEKLVSKWHFGNHGDPGGEYSGEAERYGVNGWKVAQDYFRDGSETALRLLDLKRGSRLENPLWGEGLGNPWEGGDKNPWRDKIDDPLVYHWSRFVHLFSNQLGFGIEDEVALCSKQSEGYRRVVEEFGMRW